MFFRSIGFKLTRDFRWLTNHLPVLYVNIPAGVIGVNLSVIGATASPTASETINAGVLSYASALISTSVSAVVSTSILADTLSIGSGLLSPSVSTEVGVVTQQNVVGITEQLLSPIVQTVAIKNVAIGSTIDYAIAMQALASAGGVTNDYGKSANSITLESFTLNADWGYYSTVGKLPLEILTDGANDDSWVYTDDGNNTQSTGVFEAVPSGGYVDPVFNLHTTKSQSGTSGALEVHITYNGSAVYDYSEEFGSGYTNNIFKATIPGSYPAGAVFEVSFGRSGGGSPSSKIKLDFYEIWIDG